MQLMLAINGCHLIDGCINGIVGLDFVLPNNTCTCHIFNNIAHVGFEATINCITDGCLLLGGMMSSTTIPHVG